MSAFTVWIGSGGGGYKDYRPGRGRVCGSSSSDENGRGTTACDSQEGHVSGVEVLILFWADLRARKVDEEARWDPQS